MTERIESSAELPTADQPPAPRTRGRPRRRPRGIGLGWLALLALLAAAMIGAPGDRSAALTLPNPDGGAVIRLRAEFGRLPDLPFVLVGMDADLGTYPEIRPAIRAAFDDLMRRGASLAFVSLTAEGRAIAAAEVERLHAMGARDGALLDIGYVAGVEAGLVRLVGTALPASATGQLADAVRRRGGGLAAFDLALLVGGSDVGPRTWIEQVAPRLPDLPLVAIAPTFAQPELSPYLRSGQLTALLATVRDAAAYVEVVSGEGLTPLPDEPQRDQSPSALAMLVGMVVALLVLARLLFGAIPAIGRRSPHEANDEEGP
ncbi:MAG TPA: hypothetical protein VFH90_07665 [Candidatus Limnocylindria bacterium]|nr:hypothetical protein [Candidatus Limnocylindria bacterium]